MGLFDELLKKPTANPPTDSGNTGGTSGPTDQGQSGSGYTASTTDPLASVSPPPIQIQKTEETSITTESPANTAPSSPPPVTVIAESDTSSILINSEPSVPATITITENNSPEVSHIITTSSEGISENIIGNIEIAGVSSIEANTSEVVDLGNLFGKTEESQPVSTEEVVVLEGSPIIEPTISLLGDNEATNPVDIQPTATVVEAKNSTDDVLAQAISILGEESTITSPTEIANFPQEEEVMITDPISIQPITQETVESYEHPSEFITASIARIDDMIARIDTAHGTKLEEALGYKTEKEKYTTLEEQAYADAEKYVTEKEHALSMRNYFVEQGKATGEKTEEKISEPVASVETTLTGLAVQNAVSETVKSEKKTKAKKEEKEETLGILGL